jgi:hypothetical protein
MWQSPRLRERTGLWTATMVLGVLVLLGGLAGLANDLTRSPRTARADAVVVDVIQHVVNRGGWRYQPVLEFTADGRRVRFAPGVQVRYRRTFPIGSVQKVEYDPGNPADARLDSTWGRWGQWLAVIGFGLMLFVIGGLGRRPRYVRPGPPPEPHGA